MLSEELRYKLLKLIEASPRMSQRGVAREMGVSLGKVNYCLKALVERGWVKAGNFKNSGNKSAYMYYLTPRGFDEKTRVTARFLKAKVREYEELKIEIQELESEAARQSAGNQLRSEGDR
jgi:EPS-associated MarR family transcriptional regulator